MTHLRFFYHTNYDTIINKQKKKKKKKKKNIIIASKIRLFGLIEYQHTWAILCRILYTHTYI